MGVSSYLTGGAANAGINAGSAVNNANAISGAASSAANATQADSNYQAAIGAFQAAEESVMAKNIEFQTIQAGWAPVQKVAGANASS